MKLRTRFLLLFTLLLMIPMIFTFYSYNRYRRAATEQIKNYSSTVFHNAVIESNSSLANITQSLSFLTFYSNDGNESVFHELKKFRDGKNYSSFDIWNSSQYFKNMFQNLLISNPYLRGIYIFTPGGLTFSNSIQGQDIVPFYDPREDDWYQQTVNLEGKYYISSVLAPNMIIEDSDSIFMARSIHDVYTHEFLGVLLVNCDPAILDLSKISNMAEPSLLTISNRNTNEILYSNLDISEGSIISSRNQVTMARDLDLSPLVLTATFDYSGLFSEFDFGSSLLTMIAVAVLLSFFLTSLLVSKTLIAPLESLSQAMAEQKDTAFDFSSPYMNRADEIGTLYREYAQMLDKLESSIKRNYKDKLVLMDAQMKSLEARINSHFLFNTLESINSIAELDNNEQIATMSLALGDMFRYSIKTQSELVSLREEIKHVDAYVSIQRIRFSNRFTLIKDIPEELYHVRVLKLILQPLVENALYHGLDNCAKGDRITITVRQNRSELNIRVSDNGKGITSDVLAEINERLREEASFTELGQRTKQSIGLKNIHSRIELYYGKGYGLHIDSAEGEGTTVSIHIPMFRQDEGGVQDVSIRRD